jgi:hypothetical protein
MNHKFRLGDRVIVYATLNGIYAESKGKIRGVESDGKRLIVGLDGRSGYIYAHYKQCRKLVPKKSPPKLKPLTNDETKEMFKWVNKEINKMLDGDPLRRLGYICIRSKKTTVNGRAIDWKEGEILMQLDIYNPDPTYFKRAPWLDEPIK